MRLDVKITLAADPDTTAPLDLAMQILSRIHKKIADEALAAEAELEAVRARQKVYARHPDPDAGTRQFLRNQGENYLHSLRGVLQEKRRLADLFQRTLQAVDTLIEESGTSEGEACA